MSVLGLSVLFNNPIGLDESGLLRALNAGLNAILVLHVPATDGAFGFVDPNDPRVSAWIHLYTLHWLVVCLDSGGASMATYCESLLVPYGVFLDDGDTSVWLLRRLRCASKLPFMTSVVDGKMDRQLYQRLRTSPEGTRLMSELVYMQLQIVRNIGWLS
jgi:hypothetical protein